MPRCNRRGFSIIGLLLSLVIIAALYLVIMKMYFKNAIGADAQKTMAEQGIDASSYAGMVKSAEKAAANANDTIKKQEEDIQKQFKGN